MANLQLDTSVILGVSLDKYGNEFSFIINGQEFKTTQLISDILSPKIRKIHLNDPLFNQININTQYPGNFSNILKLLDFKFINFDDNEIQFVSEIIEILEIDKIKNCINDNNISVNNVISKLKIHQKFPQFYSKQLCDEIEFLSSHFFELLDEQREELSKLDIKILNEIINNDHLRIKDEDQLLKFINELYSNDVKYSILYEYVYFVNVTSNTMSEFIEIFDFNDISNQTWKQIASRLKEEVTSNQAAVRERYNNFQKVKENKNQSFEGLSFYLTKSQSFTGIINYLKEKTKNIENEIDFTSSSCDCYSCQPINVSEFEKDEMKYFLSKNKPNSWICFYFKNHQVIPTYYTIRTFGIDSNPHPKSWVIECSNDNTSWDVVDTQTESPYLQKGWAVHAFKIDQANIEPYKYIRMKMTGKNTNGSHSLLIDAFEIYGTLI